jgi:transcriptional regulator with XRE-family HTH domain
MTDSFDILLTGVGPRLRDLRLASARTLAQISESTGISVSTLSRLESGQRKPTLELLLPLAQEYSVAIDELVHAPHVEDPRVEQHPFTRNGRTFVPLSRASTGLQAFRQIIPGLAPGTESARPAQKTHEGYDWFYVLSGRMRLALGEHDLVLGPGEVAEFDCRVPHGFDSAGPDPVEVLSLFGRQGERMHVRASTIDRSGTPSA